MATLPELTLRGRILRMHILEVQISRAQISHPPPISLVQGDNSKSFCSNRYVNHMKPWRLPTRYFGRGTDEIIELFMETLSIYHSYIDCTFIKFCEVKMSYIFHYLKTLVKDVCHYLGRTSVFDVWFNAGPICPGLVVNPKNRISNHSGYCQPRCIFTTSIFGTICRRDR